jgi:hypothetical protein
LKNRQKHNTYLPPDQEAKFRDYAEKSGRVGDLEDYDLRGYYAAVQGRMENGHLPDTYKKPNHPTFSSESQYNGAEGLFGGSWVPTPVDGVNVYQAQPTNTYPNLEGYFREVEPSSILIKKRKSK